MKLKSKVDDWTFLHAHDECSTQVLTAGKVYTGQIGYWQGETCFCCFDNAGRWYHYPIEHFEPLDGGE